MRRATCPYHFPWLIGGISIHALREEGDNGFEKTSKRIERFLSTPSVRRATNTRSMRCRAETISIHALREEGDFCPVPDAHAFRHISIHALREEGDNWMLFSRQAMESFLSTPSVRRATTSFAILLQAFVISIHALREEGDLCLTIGAADVLEFLSTPSVRRATRRIIL